MPLDKKILEEKSKKKTKENYGSFSISAAVRAPYNMYTNYQAEQYYGIN